MMTMTAKQIEQAANDYAQMSDTTKDRREVGIAFNAFLAGAEFRQAEIDTLTADIEHYKQDIADGLKREEVARKVIEDKRGEVKRMKNTAAPELLEALERVVRIWNAPVEERMKPYAEWMEDAIRDAQKAIDKAKGGEQ